MKKNIHKPRYHWAIGAGLTIITIVVFLQIAGFDFLIYDDSSYVVNNPHVQSGLNVKSIVWAFTSSHSNNWHPLTWLSLMADCQFFGVDSHSMHLINLLFHTANTVLLFILLFRITGALWSSAFVAAAFAIHPLHIQSVAWVAERKDVLSTLLWLLTMLLYVRYTERPSIGRYVITIFAFALGLMAKPMLVTLPFILLLLDYWPLDRVRWGPGFAEGLRRGKQKTEDVKRKTTEEKQRASLKWLIIEKIPLLILSFVSCVITIIVQQRSGAVKDIVKFPFDVRIINALNSYVGYIVKMFWPANLSVFYPHSGRSLHLSDSILPALILVVISILVIRFAKSRGYLLFGWFWYICTLLPVIGLVQVGNQSMADRYTYIPLIGLFIIIAWGASELLTGYVFGKKVLAITATAVLLAMGVSTYVQLGYWQNSITIFQRAVEINPNDLFSQGNLGTAFLSKNSYDDAIVHFEKALQIDPCDTTLNMNIGVALFRKNKLDEAINYFEKAAAIDPCNVPARLNLAFALAKQGKKQQAIEQCNEILRIAPGRTEAVELRKRLLQQRQ
jgi:protein O-mannosyl-transferase